MDDDKSAAAQSSVSKSPNPSHLEMMSEKSHYDLPTYPPIEIENPKTILATPSLVPAPYREHEQEHEYAPAALRPPPTNFLRIETGTRDIFGSWRIDTSLDIPESFMYLDPDRRTAPHDHLILSTLDATSRRRRIGGSPRPCHIDAKVELVRYTWSRRAYLDVWSSGRINFRTRPNGQRFSLYTYSKGTETQMVFIPRTFFGPIRAERKYEASSIAGDRLDIRFSPSVTAELLIFSNQDMSRSYFLGPFAEAHYDRHSWRGDQLILFTDAGTIVVQYDDEEWSPFW
ncbi:hypothetical protein SISNIDRAFT_487769 [Sistotremastrum niveocremeum HHB9708]|uniref:DUF7330 domain-containing protein n=1 Tax=Sistotremastrum niveocremeum HHB9708 TaxID=1314777 RepID=A0A164S1M0_9AGAM|nr:hypothetical protein SISNIDRAFT_487769 [Sistotremastrum niveocremeum HHB9708]